MSLPLSSWKSKSRRLSGATVNDAEPKRKSRDWPREIKLMAKRMADSKAIDARRARSQRYLANFSQNFPESPVHSALAVDRTKQSTGEQGVCYACGYAKPAKVDPMQWEYDQERAFFESEIWMRDPENRTGPLLLADDIQCNCVRYFNGDVYSIAEDSALTESIPTPSTSVVTVAHKVKKIKRTRSRNSLLELLNSDDEDVDGFNGEVADTEPSRMLEPTE